MQIERTAAPLGACVRGVDVRDLSTAQWQEINSAFCEHKVLSFPGQQLTPQEQMAFGRRWGELVRHPYAGMSEFPDLIELKNMGKRRDINQHWHTDMSYNAAPPKLTMLYALSAPDFGGDTAFANQEQAFDELSAGLQEQLQTMRAVHTLAGLAQVYNESTPKTPDVEHPVIRTHDETGRKALYVCRAFTKKFVGWSKPESEALLEYLYAHSVRPEFQARHRWQAGDLVMWDNRSVLHFAVHDHAPEQPRVIHRLQVAGPVPA